MSCIVMVPGTNDRPRYGPARHIYEISKRLGKTGFTIVNVAPSSDGSFSLQLIDESYIFVKIPVANLQWIRMPLNKMDRYLRLALHYTSYKDAVKKLLSNLEKPPMLHTHGFCTITQPKNGESCKRVVTIHGFGQLDIIAKERAYFKATILHSLLKKIYANADHYTTFSSTMKSIAIKLYGLDPNNITIVPHGVDAKFFSSKMDSGEIKKFEAKFKLNKPFRVLFLGHLVRGKGVDVLLKAFEILKHRRCDIMLLLKMSLGHDYFETLRLIDRFNLKHIVRVITSSLCEEDLRTLYKASNMFVNFHLLSGHSTALLEAMASGIPPIIYKNSSNRDIVDRSCGIMLETLDPAELANVIELLVDDKVLAKSLGQNAMNRAIREYDWDQVVVPRYASVYNNLTS